MCFLYVGRRQAAVDGSQFREVVLRHGLLHFTDAREEVRRKHQVDTDKFLEAGEEWLAVRAFRAWAG